MIFKETPVKNCNTRPEGTDVDCIVIHHTGGGTIAGAISWWDDPKSQASAHFLIDTNGDVYRCVLEDLRAWHSGLSELQGVSNVNDFSIGIELLGDGSLYTIPQIDALVELTVYLMQTHKHITVERIVGHEDICIPRSRKAGDPGKDFPWGDYRADLRAALGRVGL